jgi:hypothetical protein
MPPIPGYPDAASMMEFDADTMTPESGSHSPAS